MRSNGCISDPTGEPVDTEAPRCAGCRRRKPTPDYVCQHCRDTATSDLEALLTIYPQLGVALVPGQSTGEKIRASSPHSAPAAAVSVMSLLNRSRLAESDMTRLGRGWTPDGAELGILPWVDAWARVWRRRHEHHRPTLVAAKPGIADPDRVLPRPVLPTLFDPEGRWKGPVLLAEWSARRATATRRLAEWLDRRARITERGGRVVLGLGPALPPACRPDDPLAEQWGARHQAPDLFALGRGVGYLTTWLDWACDSPELHPDIDGFLVGLRELAGRCRAALGETTTRVDVGRCPADRTDRHGEVVTDLESGIPVPCGARLPRLDPHAEVSRIECPVCATVWERHRWLILAGAQRRVFGDDAPGRESWEGISR